MPSFSSSTARMTRPGVFDEVLTVNSILPIGSTDCPWCYPLRVTYSEAVTRPERAVLDGREQRLRRPADPEAGEQRPPGLGHGELRVRITFGEHAPKAAYAVDQTELR